MISCGAAAPAANGGKPSENRCRLRATDASPLTVGRRMQCLDQLHRRPESEKPELSESIGLSRNVAKSIKRAQLKRQYTTAGIDEVHRPRRRLELFESERQ